MPKIKIADNDNAPRHADSMSLSQRCAWLGSLPDNAAPRLAWPSFERLAHKRDLDGCKALLAWRDLTAPAGSRGLIAANDNEAASVGLPKRRIRPSIPEIEDCLEQAGEETRNIVRTSPNGMTTTRAATPPIVKEFGETKGEFMVRLGGLRFMQSGALFEYRNRRGTWLRPSERPTRQIRLPAKSNFASHDSDHDRLENRAIVRAKMGDEADVLDLATSDATAREIGERLGKSGKAAERLGVRKINDAINKFKKIAA